MALSYETLYNDHWNEGLSCSDIARKHGVHVQTIKRWINKLNVPMRNKSDAAHLWMTKKRKRKLVVKKERPIYKKREILFNHYWNESLCTREIAELYGVKKATIQYWLNKLNVPKRDLSSSKVLSENKIKRVHTNNKTTVECAWCGKKLLRWPYRVKSTDFFYCSKECKGQHWSEMHSGENAFNWKGGQWKETADKRWFSEYQIARHRARCRDKWTCQLCGSKSNIIAHHIIPVREDSSKIFDMNNLISLCDDCHRKKVNGNEEYYKKLFTDIVAKTVNCWDPLKPLLHNVTSNGEREGSKS